MGQTTEKEEFYQDQDLDMGGLFQSLWQARFSIVYSMLAMAGLLLAFFLLLFILLPQEQVFQSAVNFTFFGQNKDKDKDKDNEQGYYPNGIKFSLNDLLSPLVLKKVWKDNHLKQKKIKFRDFAPMVSIMPYAVAYRETSERYRKRLADRKLTFAERKEISNGMTRDLKAQSQNNALIQLHHSSLFGISPQLGVKLVTDIPKVWAQISITQRGVLKTAQEVSNKPLVDGDRIKKFDYPVMLDILNQSGSALKKRLRELRELDGSETIMDKDSNHSVESLGQQLKDIMSYELPSLTAFLNNAMIYKTPNLAQSYLQERIFEETMRLKQVSDKIKGIEAVLADRINPEKIFRPGHTPQSGNLSPQIDQGFLDKIIDMVKKSENFKLREELVRKSLALKDKLTPIHYNLSNLKRSLKSLAQYDSNKPGLEEKEKEYTLKVLALSKRLNKYWKILGNLFQQLSNKRFSNSSNLYQNMALERYMISYHPVMTRKTVLLSLISLVLAGLAGLFVSLFRQRRTMS